jgi:hypothetical protein
MAEGREAAALANGSKTPEPTRGHVGQKHALDWILLAEREHLVALRALDQQAAGAGLPSN